MYESHWKLKSKPFQARCPAHRLYPSSSYTASLLRLRYCFDNGGGLAVLLGSLGRHQEGLEHPEFLRANHVSAVTAFSHAVTLIHLGRNGDALAALEADRKLLPEDDSIRLLEARLLAAGASLVVTMWTSITGEPALLVLASEDETHHALLGLP